MIYNQDETPEVETPVEPTDTPEEEVAE